MEVPPEILFQSLLDLPYEDIVSYCQTSQQALEICQTEYFWDQKARKEFRLPLNLVTGTSPHLRYRILSEILRAKMPWNWAIRTGQSDLLRAIWNPDYAFRVDSGILVNAALQGHFNVIETVKDLILNASDMNEAMANETLSDTFQGAYDSAFDTPELLSYFSSISPPDYDLYPDELYPDYIMSDELADALINDAKAHGDIEMAQRLAIWAIQTNKFGLIEHLLSNYPNDSVYRPRVTPDLYLEELLETALEACPMAKLIYEYKRNE